MKTLFANRGIQAKSALLPPAQRRPFYEDARGVQACAWPGSLPAAEALLGKPVPPLSCSLYRRFADAQIDNTETILQAAEAAVEAFYEAIGDQRP